jgi:hypothetical protein
MIKSDEEKWGMTELMDVLYPDRQPWLDMYRVEYNSMLQDQAKERDPIALYS